MNHVRAHTGSWIREIFNVSRSLTEVFIDTLRRWP